MAQPTFDTTKYPLLKAFAGAEVRHKVRGGRREVFSPARRRWLVLTPEEWVRQHAISFLAALYNIPFSLVVEEYPVLLNGQNQRADVVIFDQQTKPWMLVECKAADVAIDQSVLSQAIRYNSVVGARYVVLTNGLCLYAYTTSDGITYSKVSVGSGTF